MNGRFFCLSLEEVGRKSDDVLEVVLAGGFVEMLLFTGYALWLLVGIVRTKVGLGN
jgi:hypothetical protein